MTAFSCSCVIIESNTVHKDFALVVPIEGLITDYGNRAPNGTWDSYLGALQRGDIDLFVGPLTDTDVRRQDFQLFNTGT